MAIRKLSPKSLPRPNPWRVVLGFVLAPLLAAGLFCILTGDIDFRLFKLAMFVGAYPATIVFGVPAYFLLRGRVRPRLVTLAAVGGVISIIPWLIIFMMPGADYAEVGNCVTVVNGRTTLCGYFENLKFLLFEQSQMGILQDSHEILGS